MADSKRPSITLFTDATPNGIKISMALEELGLPYEVEHLNISTNVQKRTDGQKIRIFESGSVFQYLIEQYDKDHKISYPAGSREHYEVNNWVFFQNAGLGPMQGQSNHFTRYAPEKIPYAINRYQNETRRLYGVLDKHLANSKSGFLVGDHISIADITNVSWVIYAGWAGVDIEEFPQVKKWEEMLYSRPAIKKGCDVPKPLKIKELLKDKELAEQHAKQGSQWIVSGMQQDSKK